MWMDTPEKWDRVALKLREEGKRGNPCGLDTEFAGVNLRKESPVAKSELVCWSVAIFDGRTSPRGWRRAVGIGLPAEAADHPGLRAWLESDAEKVAHNSPAEAHTFGNRGITVGGLINTLNLARWMIPGRLEYGLDALGQDVLGVGKAGSYKDFVEPNVVTVTRRKTSERCECGAVPCRKKRGPFHTRVKHVEEWPEEVVRGTKGIDIRTIRPGHAMWEPWLAYMIRDAELALSLWDALRLADRRVVMPWSVPGPAVEALPTSIGFRDRWGEEAA